jgi:hypothetical protein
MSIMHREHAPPRREDMLRRSMDELAHILKSPASGGERAWAERAGWALDGIEEALCRHTATVESGEDVWPEGHFKGPSMERQMSQLRRQHVNLLEEADALRRDALRAAQPSMHSAHPPSPVNAAAPAGMDLEALRQRGQEFLQTLRRHTEQETELLQDSVTTEVGAGD